MWSASDGTAPKVAAADSVGIAIHLSKNVTDTTLPVQFGASVTGTAPYTYVWNFGDDVTSSAAAPSHSYLAAGAMTVVLHVIDSTGGIGTATAKLAANLDVGLQLPPNVQTLHVGQPFQFPANVIGGTAPFTYFWRFGDGASSSDVSPTHGFESPGLYTVTLVVNDSVGGTAEATMSVEVPPSLTSSGSGPSTESEVAYAIVGGAILLALVAVVIVVRRRS